jgi:hypothetical protein
VPFTSRKTPSKVIPTFTKLSVRVSMSAPPSPCTQRHHRRGRPPCRPCVRPCLACIRTSSEPMPGRPRGAAPSKTVTPWVWLRMTTIASKSTPVKSRQLIPDREHHPPCGAQPHRPLHQLSKQPCPVLGHRVAAEQTKAPECSPFSVLRKISPHCWLALQ